MDHQDVDANTWKFAQCFGDKTDLEDVTEADIISTVEFNQTGDYLATGDKGGRVVLFERVSNRQCEYKFFAEFQSHEPEFDYLKSLEIEEKINKIKWLPQQSAGHYMLTTNDKTIKLWKVWEKSSKLVVDNNLLDGQRPLPVDVSSLKLPQLVTRDPIMTAHNRRTYQNAHAYHINSISVNSDSETYLSADDLRINLWNLAISNQSFNIVDIKPTNMEDLTEVITSAEFHPSHCNLFMYSSSKGTIKLCDMRTNALCDAYDQIYEEPEDPSSKNFFSEIISSISDVKFSLDGKYILSRDYMALRVWDIAMPNRPVKTIPVHDYLRSRLCDLYENDCIFDKFECSFSGDSTCAMTGSYNNYLSIYSLDGSQEDVLLQADKNVFRSRRVATANTTRAGGVGQRSQDLMADINVDAIDFNRRILHASWHPRENTIAVAATNNLFIFTK
ncbi:hypothetical protein GQ42DRAFT_117607 [Ramicandelaber brevisporus]|nr:hypothetical protein GQ42DRAFT_117607 [Ramicandelaber brevisporus]